MAEKRKSFWEDMMSGAGGGISSKRVLGSFILVVLLIVIVIKAFMGTDAAWFSEAFVTMLIGAFSLLGIGVFEKRIGNRAAGKKDDTVYDNQTDETQEDENNDADNCA